jgi:hypothetical protein
MLQALEFMERLLLYLFQVLGWLVVMAMVVQVIRHGSIGVREFFQKHTMGTVARGVLRELPAVLLMGGLVWWLLFRHAC